MRRTLALLFGVMLFGMLSVAMAADLNRQNPPTIALERELHFTSDEGDDIAVAPDSYVIAPGSEFGPAIELRKGTEKITLPAAVTSHQEQISSHVAILIPDDSDTVHIVLLFPGGKAFDAIGYSNVVRPRDATSQILGPSRIASVLIQQGANKGVPATAGSAVSNNPSVASALQQLAAEQAQAKAELDPAALLARIKTLELILSCLYINGFNGFTPAFPPPQKFGPAETPDVRWNGMRCPGK